MPPGKSNSITLTFPFCFSQFYDTDEILIEARLVGNGFILKENIVEMLAKAVDALLQKQSFFPPVDRSDQENS